MVDYLNKVKALDKFSTTRLAKASLKKLQGLLGQTSQYRITGNEQITMLKPGSGGEVAAFFYFYYTWLGISSLSDTHLGGSQRRGQELIIPEGNCNSCLSSERYTNPTILPLHLLFFYLRASFTTLYKDYWAKLPVIGSPEPEMSSYPCSNPGLEGKLAAFFILSTHDSVYRLYQTLIWGPLRGEDKNPLFTTKKSLTNGKYK